MLANVSKADGTQNQTCSNDFQRAFKTSVPFGFSTWPLPRDVKDEEWAEGDGEWDYEEEAPGETRTVVHTTAGHRCGAEELEMGHNMVQSLMW